MLKTRRIAAVVLLAFLPATIALPATAQEDPVTLQARARFKEGVEAFDKGKFEEARLAFLQAYTLKKHPSVLLNLAQSSAKAGHYVDAARYFQTFLSDPTVPTDDQRRDAEAGLSEARQKIGRIEVVAPPGTEISLGDKGKIGTAPMGPIDVDPGQHTLTSGTESVTVTAAAGQTVEARLGPVGPAPGGAPGAAPFSALDVTPPPGADAGEAKRTNLLTPPANMVPVYAGLGAGAVGLVGAVVFGLFKSEARSNADQVANDIRNAASARGIPLQGACNNPSAPDLKGACATLQDNNSKVDTNAAIANVSLAVMGAGLVFAGAWYAAAPKRDDVSATTASTPPAARRAVVTPWAGWRDAGLSVAGEF